jgi:hypothetical protein
MRYRTFAVGKIDEELRMNNQIDLVLPKLYAEFLSKIDKAGELIIENTGITLYSRLDLLERNSTYQIEEWEPDFFLIGQDGDVAFFIKKDSDDTIYMNDLGALGSLEMKPISLNIFEFVQQVSEHYDDIF